MIFLSETVSRHLTSSDVTGRGAGTTLHGLPDQPRAWKNPVTRNLGKLRDEDL